MLLKDHSCCTVKNRLENRTLEESRLLAGWPGRIMSVLSLGVFKQRLWLQAGGCKAGPVLMGWGTGQALRPDVSPTCPTTLKRPRASPHPCRPGLEPPHTSLHPWQEAEALAGDAGPEPTVQDKQGLGTPLGPVLL